MDRKEIIIYTEKQFTSLNDELSRFVEGKKGLGMVNVFVTHTTCAIKILEGELLLLSDINNYLDTTFPRDKRYMHDQIELRDVPVDERINGFSHMRQLFFGSEINVPVEEGKLMLGKWQSVYLIEFDPIRDRKVFFTYFD